MRGCVCLCVCVCVCVFKKERNWLAATTIKRVHCLDIPAKQVAEQSLFVFRLQAT